MPPMKMSLPISLLALALASLSACGGNPPDEAQDAATDRGEATSDEAQPVALFDLTGDPVAGEALFARCAACHSLEPGQNNVGPTLHAIVGRAAGSVAGFRYSDANANADLVWSEENLFEYLEAPRAFMPGTYMVFPGLRDPQERADLIAYLASDPA